jgi:hypothetical protein
MALLTACQRTARQPASTQFVDHAPTVAGREVELAGRRTPTACVARRACCRRRGLVLALLVERFLLRRLLIAEPVGSMRLIGSFPAYAYALRETTAVGRSSGRGR